jgi:hypothetical protein
MLTEMRSSRPPPTVNTSELWNLVSVIPSITLFSPLSVSNFLFALFSFLLPPLECINYKVNFKENTLPYMCRVTFNQKLYTVALRPFANTNMAKASGVSLYSNNVIAFSHRQENLGPLILSSSRGTGRIYLVHIELSEEGFYR